MHITEIYILKYYKVSIPVQSAFNSGKTLSVPRPGAFSYLLSTASSPKDSHFSDSVFKKNIEI